TRGLRPPIIGIDPGLVRPGNTPPPDRVLANQETIRAGAVGDAAAGLPRIGRGETDEARVLRGSRLEGRSDPREFERGASWDPPGTGAHRAPLAGGPHPPAAPPLRASDRPPPRRIWAGALMAGIAVGLVSWGAGELLREAFPAKKFKVQRLLQEFIQSTLESQ